MNPKITLSFFVLPVILISYVMPAFASSNGIYVIGGISITGMDSVNIVEAHDPLKYYMGDLL